MILRTAPLSADVTIDAYLARYPVLTFGSLGVHASLRFASSSSDTFTLIVLAGISIAIISPSSIRAIGPPVAASGETWPIDAPLDAPQKRPSVINATLEPSPMPAMADVGFNISLMPGPPFGPS